MVLIIGLVIENPPHPDPLPRGGRGDVVRRFGGTIFFHDTDMHSVITTIALAEKFTFPPP